MALKKDYFQSMGAKKVSAIRKITRNGFFQVFAVDQVGSFKKAVADELAKKNNVDAKTITERQVIEVAGPLKQQFARVASKHVSAMLLDTTPYGLDAVKFVDKGTGLLLKLEASTSVVDKNNELVFFEPIEEGGSGEYYERVAKSFDYLAGLGASAIKLLLNYNPVNEPAHAAEQKKRLETIYKVSEDKQIPLLLEPMSFFFIKDENGQRKTDKKNPEFAKQKLGIVLQTARDLSPLCDVFKVEFPVDLKYLLTELAAQNSVSAESVEKTRAHLANKLGLTPSAGADEIINQACKKLDGESATPWAASWGLPSVMKAPELAASCFSRVCMSATRSWKAWRLRRTCCSSCSLTARYWHEPGRY
ncbi:hypothetical protein HY993_02065, partial [Candidatus Micrarchaeota archaeon]|nr:hypothetical protein [Candidatus Micrarchaeota archaeon]